MNRYFPYASAYAEWMRGGPERLQERQEGYHAGVGFHWSERHLQCLWFDGRYRPVLFRLPKSETMTVLDPGTWNCEAGPDFINATLLIQPGGRHVRGDVEVHVRPTDWDAHKHTEDKAYDTVVAHVTWFAGPPAKSLPKRVLPLSLDEPISARRDLSLDDIDLKAYPHNVLPKTPRPCEVFLKNDPDRARDLLQAAGQYRLQSKAARIRARLLQSGDRHQVFYEEFMAALGYKHNQHAFRGLARLVPVAQLKGFSRDGAFARLLAAARLLPDPEVAMDEEARKVIRSLWDLAWKHGEEVMAGELEWRFHHTRPQNAPVRRLAAAALLFSGLRDLLCDVEALATTSDATWFLHVRDRLALYTEWPFWNQRLTFASPLDPAHPHVLLGKGRLAAIITNVILPFVAAEGRLPQEAICYLPPEDISSPMRLTATHLFGRDHNPAVFYADNGLLQQGLLQVHLDFCLTAASECEGCTLCQTLAREG
jgi:hypothetical protein